MIKINNLTFGSDPEYFVINEKTGMILSSINLVNGTKEIPEPLGDGFFILKDNILVEGNLPPASTKEGFMENVFGLKKRILEYLKAINPSLGLLHKDCADVDMAFLSHPEAMQFGCSPYLNAWDKQVHRANDLSSESYRTAGMHIHIGYDLEDGNLWSRETINNVITKAFDFFVVIPSCMIHVDKRRFENYGGLGQYRETSYGLECRSLGAFFANPEYSKWVIDQTVKAIEFITDDRKFYKLEYMKKPETRFIGGKFIFDSSVYEYLGINFNEQVVEINKFVHA